MRAKTLLTALVKVLDALDGAKDPIHPLTLRKKRSEYITKSAACFLLSSLIVGVGVSSLFDRSPGASDAASGLLIIGLSLGFFTLLGLMYKWQQLKRIPIDVSLKPPRETTLTIVWRFRERALAFLSVWVASAIVIAVGLSALLAGSLLYKQYLQIVAVSVCVFAAVWFWHKGIPIRDAFLIHPDPVRALWLSIAIFCTGIALLAVLYEPPPGSYEQYLKEQQRIQGGPKKDSRRIEEEKYQQVQTTVLENLAGMIPESEPYLTVIQRDGRTIRVNKRSGSWCVLIDSPSNPLLYGSCSESDDYAKNIRDQKSLWNRVRHFLGEFDR